MPKKSNKRSNKRKSISKRITGRTRKQKPIMMVGCSKKNKKSCKQVKSLDNKSCPNCGPNCHCGPNCKCKHPCPGTCYLNRRLKGGSGCGSCGCPLAPLSWKQMNQFGGDNLQKLVPEYVANSNNPVIQSETGNFSPIPGINQNGGTCGACQAVQAGGSFYKPAGPMPGPFTGSPWKPDLGWPGMNGIGGDRNYLANYGNVIQNDPQQQMSMNDAGYTTKNSMVGGYTYDNKKLVNRKGVRKSSEKSSSRTKTSSSPNSLSKGGGLVPQDLVNLGRDFTYNFKTAYNALNGYKAPVDPAPYKGQLTGSLNKINFV